MTNYYSDVYITDKYSLLASKKYNPVVLGNVDEFIDDYYMGEKVVELAESKYQEITIGEIIGRNDYVNAIVSNLSVLY